MTRESQIDNAACEQPEGIGHGKDGLPKDLYDGFIRGAQWADQNPKRPLIDAINECNIAHAKLEIATEALAFCADRFMSKKAKEALEKIKDMK